MFDGRGLASFESGLDHAVFIILTGLTGICVTEVDFNSRDLIAEVDQGVLHQSCDMVCEGMTPAYVTIRTDLDVHIRFLRNISSRVTETEIARLELSPECIAQSGELF
jgi:hypothetical protein